MYIPSRVGSPVGSKAAHGVSLDDDEIIDDDDDDTFFHLYLHTPPPFPFPDDIDANAL